MKGDTTVIIDTISQKGYVLITIKITANINYYFHFPTVPSPNVRYEKFDRTNDEFGYVYWYTVLEKSVIESYINILRGQGFTVTQNADYYICIKGSITVTVDAVSVTVKDTSNISLYYKDYPTVPDFAVVVKDYWTVPTAYIVIDGNNYNYQIKTTGYGMIGLTPEKMRQADEQRRLNGDYTGDADLYDVYIDALLNDGKIP